MIEIKSYTKLLMLLTVVALVSVIRVQDVEATWQNIETLEQTTANRIETNWWNGSWKRDKIYERRIYYEIHIPKNARNISRTVGAGYNNNGTKPTITSVTYDNFNIPANGIAKGYIDVPFTQYVGWQGKVVTAAPYGYIEGSGEADGVKVSITTQNRTDYVPVLRFYDNIKDFENVTGPVSMTISAADAEYYEYFLVHTKNRPDEQAIMTVNGSNRPIGAAGDIVPITLLKGRENTIRLNGSAVNTAPNDYDYYGDLGMTVYRKAPRIEANIQVPELYTYIGDNTPIKVDITTQGVAGQRLQLYNTKTNKIYSDNPVINHPNFITITTDEGNIAIGSKIVTNTGALVKTGNTVNINKINMLNRILGEMESKNGLPKIIIVNETSRYFEDNAINKELVKDIKSKLTHPFGGGGGGAGILNL